MMSGLFQVAASAGTGGGRRLGLAGRGRRAPRRADRTAASGRRAAPACDRRPTRTLVRWVMMTSVAPRAFCASSVCTRARSPASSRLELGSSRTMNCGIAVDRARQRHALPLSAGQHAAAARRSACRSRPAARRRCRAGRPRAPPPPPCRGRRRRSGRCSRPACRRRARCPAADSRCAAPVPACSRHRRRRRRGEPCRWRPATAPPAAAPASTCRTPRARPPPAPGPAARAKLTPAQDRNLAARRRRDQPFDRQRALRRRQRHAGRAHGNRVEQLVQTGVGIARADDRLPLRDQLLQRRQGATGQDPGDDHHAAAGVQLADQRQPGGEPQHHRALRDLDELGDRGASPAWSEASACWTRNLRCRASQRSRMCPIMPIASITCAFLSVVEA